MRHQRLIRSHCSYRIQNSDSILHPLTAPQTKTRKRKDAAVLRIGKDLFGRMIGWWLHCMNINNERAGADFHRLLGLEPPSSTKTNTIVNWGNSQTNEESEFVRRIQ